MAVELRVEEQIGTAGSTGDSKQPRRLLPAQRLAALFAPAGGDIERLIAERRAAGGDVLNLALVEPELPPPAEALEQLALALKAVPAVRGAAGVPEYRSAVARWYQSRFKTSLDPNREVLPLPSIEDGIVGLAEVLLNPDDVVLVPDPSRPIYQAALVVSGARAVSLPLRPEQDFLPELKAVPLEVTAKARMLWLDYPNLPTGAVAPASFFHQVLQFAQERDLLVVHIADFSEYAYEGYRTISLLEIPGARQVCVELHSPATTYNLHGWPGAFAAGNAEALRLLRHYRQQLHHLTFVPAQRALAETMMRVGGDWLVQRNAVYQTRRDQATTVLEQLGLQLWRPKAVPAIWAGVPAGYTSAEVVELLLVQTGVLVAPGTAFGPRGEGYIQLSLTVEEARFQDALKRLRSATIPSRDVMPQGEAEEQPEAVVRVSADASGEEHRHAG
jgi:LL-diaminopimelate aminotransferase